MRDDSAGDTAIKLVSALDTGSSSDDIKNEKDTRDTEEGALNADNHNIDDDDSHNEIGAVILNRGGLISHSLSSSRLLAQRSLPKDTFSFIIISSLFSLPFLIATIVFSFQIAIFSLVSVDVIDLSNSSNPYNIPTNVESTVRATQVLAIIIAIVTQDDVKKVILILRDGYIADMFQGTFGTDATKFKWVLSLVLRAAEGLIGLFVTFMLIMQSKTVLDLLLNFSAMEFVSLLDDVAFLMLREGYFGIGMMLQATLCETKYYVPHALSLKSSRLSAVYFIIIFAVMFSGWIGIYSDQARGEYLCQRMYIQVDKVPTLTFLSGTYTVNHNEKFSGRVTSSQENGKGKIGYCEDENVWTLKIQEKLMPYDPCLRWVAKSSESFEFDVTKTTSSQWYAQMSDGGDVAAFIVDIKLICANCDDHKNKCLNDGICLTDGMCDCRNNATGFFCQIQPIHNGLCNNIFFNTIEFEYDGGDCCESSCVSTDKHLCGKDASGLVDIGYPHCNNDTEPYDQWFQSGNSVNGVRIAARSGTSVALGGRGGTILAVGDPGASVVRLFDKDGSKWVQRSEALEGPTNSQFGHVISLVVQDDDIDIKKNTYSLPILTVAVGDSSFELVRVYKCQTSGCEQIGGDINFGGSFFSLSREGDRLAIGSNYNALPIIVEIYEFDSWGGTWQWQMIGNASNPDSCPHANRRVLGVSKACYHDAVLSGDGQVLVIGTSKVQNDNYDDATMAITTYVWNATIGDWDIMENKGGSSPQATTWQKKCIALSDDGTVLAVCSKLGIAVYSLSVDNLSWMPRQIDLDIAINSASTTLTVLSVDVSGDGSTLAIGSKFSVLALKWNGTHYTQHLNSLPSGEASAISLARDGNAMAVGNPSSGNNGGVTTVYKVRPQGCTGNMKLVRISFTTDDKPEENRWTLHIGNRTIQSHDYWYEFTTFVKGICVPNDVCVKFRVFDSGGDGIQDPGGYSVMLDGEEVANGDNFWSKEGDDFKFGETKYITGNCDCPAGLTLLSIVAKDSYDVEIPMEWALSYQNKTAEREYVFTRTMDHDIEIFEECIPDDGCWHLSNPQCHVDCCADLALPNWWYNVTYNGRSEAKDGEGRDQFCPEGDETISFGKCLPGENATVKYIRPTYPTHTPTISLSPSSSSSPTLCTNDVNPDWVDGFGHGCDWYEEYDLRMNFFFDVPGCEVGELAPAVDGSTAKDNCCYCFLVANNSMPSPAITSSASPTGTTLQTKPPTKPSIVTKFDELTTENNNEDGSN